MKVLALNGSPRPIGNTSNILHEVTDLFEREGIEVEIVYLYEYQFVNCNVCLTCEIRGDGRCIDEDDGFNDLLDRMRSMMQTFLERAALVFGKGDHGLKGKVGGAIAVCGHDGASMVYNQMVDWMLMNQMLVSGSYPMPIVRALNSPQYEDDKEGMKGIHSLVEGMVSAIMRLNGYA